MEFQMNFKSYIMLINIYLSYVLKFFLLINICFIIIFLGGEAKLELPLTIHLSSSQCFTTGVTKAVECAILSGEWCI